MIQNSIYKAKRRDQKMKKYRECSFSFMRECSFSFMRKLARGIAEREKDEGELEDAHITIAEAYEGILQHYNSSALCHLVWH